MKEGDVGSLVSVVIPCWNDCTELSKLLESLRTIPGPLEVIVADASENDRAREIASTAGAIVVQCPRPNRGVQMNAGAAAALGEVLLFHHADSILVPDHVAALRAAISDQRIVGGAFHRKFDSRHPHLRWLEGVNRFLGRTGGTMFGDQSIFVRRECFRAMGGYADLPLMEDVEFSRRLRRFGKTVLLDPPMASSPRRASRNGAWKTTVENGVFLLLYHFGVSAERLHGWYYRRRES